MKRTIEERKRQWEDQKERKEQWEDPKNNERKKQ